MVSRGLLDNTLASMYTDVRFSNTYLFYAHIISRCTIKIKNDLPAPAGVSFDIDHYVLYINPELFDQYDLMGRLAILKHECLHIVLGHLTFRNEMGKRNDHYTKNIAMDCAINQQIDPDDLPDDGILPDMLSEKYRVKIPLNLSSEEYYDILESVIDEDSKSDFSTLDDHNTWDESNGNEDLQKTITKKMIEQAQEQTIKGGGSCPMQCSEWLEINSTSSEVNWKQVLRKVVGNRKTGNRSTFKRKNRRFPNREELRGKIKDRSFNLLIIVDVSGSMSSTSILKALSEVRNICKLLKTDIDMIQVDTQAYEPEKLSSKTELIQRKGNGGTFLSPAIHKAEECRISFDAVVVITDGGVHTEDVNQFLTLNKHIIWLIEPTGVINPSMNTGKMSAYKLTE